MEELQVHPSLSPTGKLLATLEKPEGWCRPGSPQGLFLSRVVGSGGAGAGSLSSESVRSRHSKWFARGKPRC